MSAEVQQPVQPATEPAMGAADSTPAPITNSQPETSILGPGEGKPSEKGTSEAVPNLTNVPKEEKLGKGEVLVESHPINEGVLNLKAPGIKGIIPSKKYFWFSEAPLEEKNLTAYISNEKSKDIAHANASHATQTGNGLLFYAKRAEDKDHPQGIFNLADLSDVAKGNFNDFNASVHGHKYTFQATTRAERDGWVVAIQTKIEDAKTSREGVIGGEGYKTQFEKYSKPTATDATTSKTRSLSRPKKEKESKSRDRSKKEAKPARTEAAKETEDETPRETTAATTTSTEPVTDKATTVQPTEAKTESTDKTVTEAAAVAAAAGPAATAAAVRKDSSDDNKKDKKSRSQSRGNKRSSIFGGLLAKKEENDDKKAAKKAGKDEKKEEKKEEKAAKQEEHNVAAAAKSTDEKKEKAAKKEEKQEEKAKKEEEAAAAAIKKEDEKAKAGEKAAAVAVEAEKEQAKQEEKEAEKLEKKAEKEAEKADKHEAKAEELIAEAAEKKEAAAATKSTATTSSVTNKEKPNKRASVFGSLFGKKETATSPTEKPKDESTAVSDTAPQLDNPVPSSVTEKPAVSTEDKAEVKPAAESPVATSTTTPTDKRRTSFFSNLGTKKERKTDTTSGDELTDGEKKKQSGGIGGLLRKASRAAPKKDREPKVESKTEPKAEPKTDGAAIPLPEKTPYQQATGEETVKDETALNNTEPTSTNATETKPTSAENIPVAAITKPEETPIVETKA